MESMAEGELPLSTDASPPSSTNVPTPGPVTEGATVGAGVLAPDIPESSVDGFRGNLNKEKKLVKRTTHRHEPKPKKKPEVPPVDECPKHGDDQPDDRYDFNHSQRGVAVLIVNTEFRNAKKNLPHAEKDIGYLTSLFEVLSFQIKVLENKTTQDLKDSLIDIRSQLKEDSDCFACLISTHGGEFPVQGSKNLRQHVLSTFDGSIPTDDIISTFNDNECAAMRGKPKLFFIQACRGRMDVDDVERVDPGVDIKTDNSEQPYANKEEQRQNGEEQKRREQTGFCSIPCYSHCLVMFSSAPGRVTFSNNHTGGWLPYCMYKVMHRFKRYDFKKDLVQVLTEVNNEMAMNMQTNIPNKPEWHQSKSAACIYHKLTKDIYFQLIPAV